MDWAPSSLRLDTDCKSGCISQSIDDYFSAFDGVVNTNYVA